MVFDRFWRTSEAPVGQELDYWAGAICEAIFELEVKAPERANFAACLRQGVIGPMAMSHIKVDSLQSLKRTPRAIARSSKPVIDIVVMKKGRALVDYGNGEVLVSAGECVLIDSREPYTFTTLPETENYSFHMPAEWLLQWLPRPQDVMGIPVDLSSPWGRSLAGIIEATVDHGVSDGKSLLCAEQIAGAFALAARPPDPNTSKFRRQMSRLVEVLREKAHDNDMTAACVAQAMNISVRSLHSLCAACGTTYGSLLLQTRLDRANRLLSDNEMRSLSIAEIGWRCGFSDPSHFSRRFRENYGVPPGSFRREALS